MLHFSRQSESKFVSVDIQKLVDRALKLAESDYDLGKKFDFKNIEIIQEIAPKMLAIPCTETEIEQVLLNLFKNASQALSTSDVQKTPKIILRAKADGKYARIEVEDNGPGMDLTVKNRLFEPFFTTKPEGVGTGLGLSVSQMIIEQKHHGRIQVESSKGIGTCFIIQLPLQRPQ